MRHQFPVSISALAVIAVVSLTLAPVAGQAPSAPATKAAAKTGTPPRTADGQPDLQGIWNYSTITPLERPSALAGKEVFTAEEAAEFEKKTVAEVSDRQDNKEPADIVGNYNDFWWERGTKLANNRTSLILDPADGRLPALTPEARKRTDSPEAKKLAEARRGNADTYADLDPGDRCIQHGKAGPPINPSGYNNNIQLFQTPDHVAILHEQIHDTRVIPLDGRPHVASQVGQWMGDARGHWEGQTLVVETTNFNGKHEQVARPLLESSERLKLVERFTRVDADTLSYEYTVTDPTIWVKPWTAQFPMKKNPGKMYEYACHEGNYSMEVRLSGARALEKAQEAAKRGSK